MKKKFLIVLIILSLVSTFVFASGSKEEKSSDGTQGITDKVVKVGNSVATSGALAPVGLPFKAGMDAYFLMVNENGGINGRTIEYIHSDDEFNPVKGKAAVDKLINDDKIFAIVGHFGTPVVTATLQDILDKGIPTVYFATGIGALYNEKAVDKERALFPVQPVYPMEGRLMVAWAVGQDKAKKIGVIYTNDDAGKDLMKGIKRESKAQNVELVTQQIAPGADDVSAAVLNMKSANVDSIIIATIQQTFPQVVKELAKQGNKKNAITSYVNADNRMTQAVKDVIGDFKIYTNAWVNIFAPESKKYQEWIAKVSNEDLKFNAFALAGWIAAHFFSEGLQRAGEDPTWTSFIDAMESEPIQNPFGGTLDYSNGQRLGTSQMALLIMDKDQALGWAPAGDFAGIDKLLNK